MHNPSKTSGDSGHNSPTSVSAVNDFQTLVQKITSAAAAIESFLIELSDSNLSPKQAFEHTSAEEARALAGHITDGPSSLAQLADFLKDPQHILSADEEEIYKNYTRMLAKPEIQALIASNLSCGPLTHLDSLTPTTQLPQTGTHSL